MIEARRKQILKRLDLLQMTNLAYGGGEKAQREYNDMLNEYYALEGIDRKREEVEASWEALRMKKRG